MYCGDSWETFLPADLDATVAHLLVAILVVQVSEHSQKKLSANQLAPYRKFKKSGVAGVLARQRHKQNIAELQSGPLHYVCWVTQRQ